MRAANLTFEASAPDGGVVSRKFAIVSKLGEGGYSTIWSVRERQPDGAEVEYAVKRVLIDGMLERLAQHEARLTCTFHAVAQMQSHSSYSYSAACARTGESGRTRRRDAGEPGAG